MSFDLVILLFEFSAIELKPIHMEVYFLMLVAAQFLMTQKTGNRTKTSSMEDRLNKFHISI